MASNEDTLDSEDPVTEGFDSSSFVIEHAGDEVDGGVSRQNPPEEFKLLNNSSDGTSTSTFNTTQATPNNACQQTGFFPWIKKELNKKAYWKCKVWMLIPLMCAIIVAVIIISMALNAAFHKDEDETFDRSQFNVPQCFDGRFQLSSKPVSNQTRMLEELENQLVDLYRSSPALGRYFSQAEAHPFRNETAVFLYKLIFVLPAEQQEELRNFTLSKEMVRNVFRQFLYDQDPSDPGRTFIDPLSLELF